MADATFNEVVNALAGRGGYTATVVDPATPGGTMPNPQTKGEFATERLNELLRDEVVAWRRRVAELAADASNIVITVSVTTT
jgi:hypothetical protein